MASGTFGSTAQAQAVLGMLVQAGARLRIGTSAMYGSLETTSPTYTAYNASIGLTAGNAVDFGKVGELGVTINAAVEPFDAVNERQPSIYIVTEETCTVNVALTQFDPDILSVLLHNSVIYNFSAPVEVLMTFGGSCAIKNRPLQLDVTNIACFLPGSQSTDLGITGIIFTIYDAIANNGLTWENMSAKELNTMSAEFMGRPVSTLALGNNLGNIYIF